MAGAWHAAIAGSGGGLPTVGGAFPMAMCVLLTAPASLPAGRLFVYGFCHIELLKRKIFIGNCRKSTPGCTERMLACHVGPACAVVLRERYASG